MDEINTMQRHIVISVIGISPKGMIESSKIQATSDDYFHPETLFSADGLRLLREQVKALGWTKFSICGFECI